MAETVLHVAVPSPVRRLFDYLPPAGDDPAWMAPGMRVRVPFGRQRLTGVIVAADTSSDLPAAKLRRAEAVLDGRPLLTGDILALLHRAADYYHHPPGEVFAAALPVRLRDGHPARPGGPPRWWLTAEGAAVDPSGLDGRAPVQGALLRHLANGSAGPDELSAAHARWRDSLRRLEERGWVEQGRDSCLEPAGEATGGPEAGPHQAAAITAITGALGGFTPFLLEGVTGSGKTEVYLQAIEATLAAGRQALVLVPEIGLTPQALARFRRLGVPLAVLHSGMSDGQRACAWLAARHGEARVVIGTRSAIFTPLPEPGLIIVDEEHDPSYKQQEGFRYSGRDLALLRGQLAGVPVVLGSATPSLESLHQANEGRYQRLELPERAAGAVAPGVELRDLRGRTLDEGLGQPMIQAVERELATGGQVLLFLNRRGYAPTLLCHDCGFVAHCERCDAHLTFHQGRGRLRCHHCGADQAVPPTCPACGSLDVRAIGLGTERIERALERLFPETGVARIDRDSTRARGRMEELLEQAHSGEARILLGTQMLAKGHHFPEVTLVGILDADQGLYSADFRAAERLAQLVTQVAGRAGRAERPGRVLIQTHHPDHPLLQRLAEEGYAACAAEALAERRLAALPPFSHLALLRAEAPKAEAPNAFLAAAARAAGDPANVLVLGPVPAPMERRAGRYRAQLLLQADRRSDLHRLLAGWLPEVEALPEARRTRWSLDVDPVDLT